MKIMNRITMILCCIFVSSWILPMSLAEDARDIISVEVGRLRGGKYHRISAYNNAGQLVCEGICDLEGKWVVPLDTNCIVTETVEGIIDSGDTASNYLGGLDTGYYIIEKTDTDLFNTAFLDVPSGYFSGFRFTGGMDECWDHKNCNYLRVMNEEGRYGYVRRNDGQMITDFAFGQMNFVCFLKGFALEQLYGTKNYVIVCETGDFIKLTEGYDFNPNSLELIATSDDHILFAVEDYNAEDYVIDISKNKDASVYRLVSD